MRPARVHRTNARHRDALGRGLTLIEVLAAVLLIGTSVTTMLVTQGRAVDQIRGSSRQLMAAEIARELIAGWRLTEADLTTAASGTVAARTGWTWRRTSEVLSVAAGISAREVTLELTWPADALAGASGRRSFHWLIDDDGT